MKKFFKKHKVLCIVLAVVLVIVGGIAMLVRSVMKTAESTMAMLTEPNIVEMERRTLVSSISATGTIVSCKSKAVTAKVSGVDITDVFVEIGDYVAEGDIICQLDTTDLSEDLSDAKTALNNSIKKSNMDLQTAQKNLEEAQEDREIHNARNEQSLINAKNDYKDQCNVIDNLKKERDGFTNSLNQKKEEIKAKEAQIESVSSGDAGSATPEADIADLQSQIATLETDCKDLNTKIASKNAEIEAQQKVADTLFQAYVKSAEVKADGERSYDSSVESRQTSLEASKLNASTTGKTEKDQIAKLEDQIEACVVKAPFAGVVTSVNVEAGDTYTGTAIVTIEDNSAYEIETQIDEYDIGKIALGQRVVVKTNATGDEELEGTVIQIAPRATKGSSGVTYTVTISLDTKHEMIRLDMTAKLSIILSEKANVLTVPYDAVVEDEEGKFYIEVMPEEGEEVLVEETPVPATPDPTDLEAMLNAGNYKRIYVTKGIESDYYIEVISDELKEGMEVVVPKTLEDVFNMDDIMVEFGATGGM